MTSLKRPYKERDPGETLEAIQCILADLGLQPAESALLCPYQGLYSIGILSTVEKVYPAMRRGHIEQAALAWVNSGPRRAADHKDRRQSVARARAEPVARGAEAKAARLRAKSDSAAT